MFTITTADSIRRGDSIHHGGEYWSVLLVDRHDAARGVTRVYVQRPDGSEFRRTIRILRGEVVLREVNS